MEEHIAQIDGWNITALATIAHPGPVHPAIIIAGHNDQHRTHWDLPKARQWAADLYWAATNAETSLALADTIATAIRRAEQLATTLEHNHTTDGA